MFLLKKGDGSLVFYLFENKEYKVGRKDCDILISNDQSISRKHATIRKENEKLFVIDNGSKYTSSYNGTILKPNEETEIKENGKIKFGAIESEFSIEKMKIITTTTKLNGLVKQEINTIIKKFNGQLIPNWSQDCSHLTADEITLTLKILHALIDNVPLITPKYWIKLLACVENNLPPPNVKDFKPRLAEAVLKDVSFEYNPKRKTLFQGKLFSFSTMKIKQQMEEIITKAGGKVEEKKLTVNEIKKLKLEFIFVIDNMNEKTDSHIESIIEYLGSKGKRPIPLQEIAMAIVQSSCEKDCNPSFNRADQVFAVSSSRSSSQSVPLVMETQSQYFTPTNHKDDKNDIIIPETVEITDSQKVCDSDVEINMEPDDDELPGNSQPLKRALDRKEDKENPSENPFKKFKLTTGGKSEQNSKANPSTFKSEKSFLSKSSVSSNTLKRKASEELISEEPKSNKGDKKEAEFKKPEKPSNPFTVFQLKKPKRENNVPIKEITNTSHNLSKIKSVKTQNLTIRDVDESVASWLNKNSKVTPKVQKEEMDQELCGIIEFFKKNVKIEIVEMEFIPRNLDTTDNVSNSTNSTKKNFKKFRKVLPLRPQKTIIKCTVPHRPGSTQGIDTSYFGFEDDQEGIRVPATGKVEKKSRFKFK